MLPMSTFAIDKQRLETNGNDNDLDNDNNITMHTQMPSECLSNVNNKLYKKTSEDNIFSTE